jgi:protein-disulfide isomerase
MEFFVSPDGRYLSRDLMDTESDPIKEEQARSRELLAGLTQGDFASVGPKDAAVTLTVFSDFQCPFCARMARMLSDEVMPDETERVRLIFRHYPLSKHAWAQTAAEATACAQKQGDDYFWSLHDFLFEHQRQLTPENFRELLSEQAARRSGFSKGAFWRCLSNREMKEKVEKDIEFGTRAGVMGTPTLFVNGQRIQAVTAAEQIRTLIRQHSR